MWVRFVAARPLSSSLLLLCKAKSFKPLGVDVLIYEADGLWRSVNVDFGSFNFYFLTLVASAKIRLLNKKHDTYHF